ncbi:lipase/acyltransferase domain-containing protein [Nocardioides daeguensis]|uniref:Bacterial Ig-like domain-containing protein n=1 Tax=Nocardioides daeguensis TaxID=908359 RepID=A0ABP6UYV5_9ACTN|nr:hypothetical protein [Nocardioides daeguensis]MBV6729181.1 hypothetical protein [Nocardioides daeguensis]MCR1774815.1 hypothetical protein [Nocardioides daeguensis]
MHTYLRAVARAAALLILLGVITVLDLSSAHATTQGTPGKIVFSTANDGMIKSWDPGTLAITPLTGDLRCPGTGTPQQANCIGADGTTSPHPSWSPDGTKIAFSKWTPDGTDVNGRPRFHSVIYVMNTDGSGAYQVIAPPATTRSQCHDDPELPCDGAGFSDFGPSWSPDGTQLAFIRTANIGRDRDDARKGSQVWTVSRLGGGATQLTHASLTEDVVGNMFEDDPRPPGYHSVAWAPAGDKLAAYRVEEFGGPYRLDRVTTGGGTSTLYAGEVSDYDWSPDAKRVVYVAQDSESVTVIEPDGSRSDGGLAQTGAVRFGPDNNGPVSFHCVSQTDCGYFEHLLPDPGSNLRVDDPDRKIGIVPVTPTDNPGRVPWDIQAQDVPILFLPGFLGSEITCGSDVLWPPSAWPGTNGDNLRKMQLGGGDGSCPGAGPTGNALGKVLGSDIYDGVQRWLAQAAPGGDQPNSAVFGWDWRKRPEDSMARLDAAVQQALAADLPSRQGVNRVTFFAHSYGGLLARWYAKDPDRAAKIARVLTAGTPWWGSPKVALPLAFGIESPMNEAGMDLVLPNDALQALARSIPGLYELFPSDSFGTWLSVNGRFQNQDGVNATTLALGARAGLFTQARDDHAKVFDGFFTNGGRIDMQALVGSGLPSFGAVDLGEKSTAVSWTNGDGTVPLRSAMQGTDIDHPLGDRVHVQAVCAVDHVSLPNSPVVLTAYRDFLLFGRTPRKTPGTCPSRGAEISVFNYHVALPQGPAPTARAALAAGPLDLATAYQQRHVDLMDLPDRTTVVSRESDPVVLTFEGQDLRFGYAPIDGDTRGTPLQYGPVTGTVEITPGEGGRGPVVTVDGVPVQPTTTGDPGDPGDPGTPGKPGAGPASAQAEVLHSSLVRGRLKLVARVNPAANGTTVAVEVAVGSKRLRLTPTVSGGQVVVRTALPKKLAHAKNAAVTLSVPGSDRVRPATVRVLAASRPPRLRVRALTRAGDRVTIAGKVATTARGVVTVAVTWTSGNESGTWTGRARIRNGRWSLVGTLPAAARTGGEVSIGYAGSAKAQLGGALLVRPLPAS